MTEQTRIIFRSASPSDLDIITDYTLKIHQHEDDGSITRHTDFYSNLKKWLSFEIENPRSLYLIAEQFNQAIGFIGSTNVINDNGFLANPTKGVIQLLWVEPNQRKQKIAKSMVEEVEYCFKEIGIEYVECSYTVVNQLASNFWSNLGYKANSITARKFIS